MSSRHIREKGIEDWRWAEKTKEEDYEKLEKGRRMSTDQKSPTEDAVDARRSWKKGPVYTFSHEASNVGLI